MTKWKIAHRVKRTYALPPAPAWAPRYAVKSRNGWWDSWDSVETFDTREEAERFILDYQRAEGTLRETPLSSLETNVWKRFGTIWAELRSLWTKIGEVSNTVEKLAADRTDLSLRVNALHNRADVLEERVTALEPKPHAPRARRTRR